MNVITTIGEIKQAVNNLKQKKVTIGLVPTMGYLHQGHLSLMQKAKQETDRVFISIFVNPAQFGPSEDFDQYPRDFERDSRLAQQSGVDYIFYPSTEEMYPKGFCTYVGIKKLDRIMCGKNRPGHFTGVCTVVLKLFHIIQPDIAVFGQKDYQQLIILKKMSRDLNLEVKVLSHKTIREKDGLAVSSRNQYLSPPQRKNAAILYQSLIEARQMLQKGQEIETVRKKAWANLQSNTFVDKVDYLDIRDAQTLDQVIDIGQKNDILIAGAIWIGNTRLIDNVVLRG